MIRTITRKEGFLKLYRSLPSIAIRTISFDVVNLLLFGRALDLVHRRMENQKKTRVNEILKFIFTIFLQDLIDFISIWSNHNLWLCKFQFHQFFATIIAGYTAGAFAAFITYPLDTIAVELNRSPEYSVKQGRLKILTQN